MKFYRLNEVPIRRNDQVFKTSPTGPFIWFIVFSGAATALLLLGINKPKMHELSLPPAFFIYFAAAFLGLFAAIILGSLRAILKPTNWLLRCDGSGIVIKYRSFQNWRFPEDDVQAVRFDYSEIAWVRIAKERRTSPGMDRGAQTQKFVYLNFCLSSLDATGLEARLQTEQKAEPAGKRIKTIVRDYPVEALPGGIVRVRWNGISPSAGKALQFLGKHARIADAESTKVDLTHHSNSTPGEEDAKILKLARSGDKIGAIELTRQVYGSSMSEAVAFVEKLQSGG